LIRLRITEIFHSLQGETRTQGVPCVFIRLTGCPLRCQYCDTAYAFKGGEWWSMDNILTEVQQYDVQYVTVTGGEPLAQKGCIKLLEKLCEQEQYEVSLETSGALDISSVPQKVIRVMDLKTPSSLESDKNLYENLNYLQPHDQIKFVICDHNDYQWSKEIINKYKLTKVCDVLFSPSHEQLSARKLAEWILMDKLSVRMQIQLHKYIWGNEPGR